MSLKTNRTMVAGLVIGSLALAGAPSAMGQTFVWRPGYFNPNGSFQNPYQMVETAACVANGGEVRISPGDYPETMRVTAPCRLTANGGMVRLGVQAQRTDLRVVCYNTHLFGDEVDSIIDALQLAISLIPGAGAIINEIIENEIPATQWADGPRSAWIGTRTMEENADVVCLQEVWDPDRRDTILFWATPAHWVYGGYRAPAYLHLGALGDLELSFSLNSGLMTYSPHVLQDPEQVVYGAEQDFFEEIATKSFLRTTVTKDGFSVGVFNTHTQSGDADDVGTTRNIQMVQLMVSVAIYRAQHPSHAVVLTGDFNVDGTNWLPTGEYVSSMASALGTTTRDASPNMRCWSDWAFCTSCVGNELRQYFNPDDGANKRLDYFLYADSLDGTTKIRPQSYVRRDYQSNNPISEDGFSTRVLSDHYGIVADFELSR